MERPIERGSLFAVALNVIIESKMRIELRVECLELSRIKCRRRLVGLRLGLRPKSQIGRFCLNVLREIMLLVGHYPIRQADTRAIGAPQHS